MALTEVTISTPLTVAQDAALQHLNGLGSWRNIFQLLSYFRGFAKGTRRGNWRVRQGTIQATATITSTGIATAADTVTVANIVLTAVASGAVPANGEWNISAVVATQAASIALAINSIATLTGKVTATSALGVVTITSVVPGLVGNGLQISESASNVTNTAFASGTNGTSYNLTLGQLLS